MAISSPIADVGGRGSLFGQALVEVLAQGVDKLGQVLVPPMASGPSESQTVVASLLMVKTSVVVSLHQLKRFPPSAVGWCCCSLPVTKPSAEAVEECELEQVVQVVEADRGSACSSQS